RCRPSTTACVDHRRLSAELLQHSTACLSAGEQTPAEERAFQCVVTVYATATETCNLACGVQPVDRLPACAQCARIQVRLDPTEGLTGQHVQLDPDQRPCGWVQNAVWGRGTTDPVTE